MIGLDRLDERQRVPDAVELVAGIADVEVRAEPDREDARVVRSSRALSAHRRVDRVAELETDAEPLEQRRLGRQRIAELAIRSDREAHESADLAARVVHA